MLQINVTVVACGAFVISLVALFFLVWFLTVTVCAVGCGKCGGKMYDITNMAADDSDTDDLDLTTAYLQNEADKEDMKRCIMEMDEYDDGVGYVMDDYDGYIMDLEEGDGWSSTGGLGLREGEGGGGRDGGMRLSEVCREDFFDGYSTVDEVSEIEEEESEIFPCPKTYIESVNGGYYENDIQTDETYV